MAEPSSRRLEPTTYPGIYRKGNRYVVVWRHRGKQHKRSFRTLTEAKRHKAQTATGDTAPTSRESFVAYAERWMDGYTGRTSKGLAESTRASYADAVDRIIVPYFRRRHPSLRLDELAPSDLRAFIAHLAERGLAPASVRRHFAPLRAMLATAYEDGLLTRNPAQGLRVIVPGERARRPKRLTPEQTRQLLAAMPAEHADLAYLMAATGLRIGEALALTWRDLDRDDVGRPVLHVRRSKTEAGLRVVPLSPETARRLTRRRAEVEHATEDAPMFASAFGTPIDAHNFRRRVFRSAAQAAGVPWATPHTLRHGMASLMAERGFSPAQIAAHLGHADGGVLALRTYIRTETIDTPSFVDEALSG
jgi:integrase